MNYTEISKMTVLAEKNRLSVDNENAKPLLKAFGLGDYLDYYLEFRHIPPWSKYNPNGYHVIDHDLNVVVNAFEIAVNKGLDAKEMKQLLLAALYHDFWHTQTLQSEYSGGDIVNIDNAKKGWMNAVQRTKGAHLEVESVEEISNLIEHSIYPRKKSVGKKKLASILCDADLIGFCTMPEDAAVKAVYGLAIETLMNGFHEVYQNPALVLSKGEIRLFFEKQSVFRITNVWLNRVSSLKALTHNWQLKHRAACVIAEQNLKDPAWFETLT